LEGIIDTRSKLIFIIAKIGQIQGFSLAWRRMIKQKQKRGLAFKKTP